MLRFPTLIVFFICALVPGVTPAVAQDVPRLSAARLGQDQGATRLVLDFDQPVSIGLRYLNEPERLEFELPLGSDISATDLPQPRSPVAGLSLEPGSSDVGPRLTITLDRPIAVNDAFRVLPDGAGRGHRLVMSLTPIAPSAFAALADDTRRGPAPDPVDAPIETAQMAELEQDLDPEPTPRPGLAIAPPSPTIALSAGAAAAPAAVAPAQPAPTPAPVLATVDESDEDERIEEIAEEPESVVSEPKSPATFDLSGYLQAEIRAFPQPLSAADDERWTGSVAGQTTVRYTLAGGRHSFVLTPFGRFDSEPSNNRRHFDLRQAKYEGSFGPLTVTAGIDTEFWGTLEAFHLVDIINQDDFLEDIDQEDKLGQPMVALAYDSGFGVLTGYFLPFFREREFADAEGRPGVGIQISQDSLFESDAQETAISAAVRWSQNFGPFDLGIAHFYGVNRDPVLLPGVDDDLNPILLPFYETIQQTSIDGQATFGPLSLRGEALYQFDNDIFGAYFAGGAGLELTVGGADESTAALVAEYYYDERGETLASPFEDDVFGGVRFTAGAQKSSQFLGGAIVDVDTQAAAVLIEASQQLWGNLKLTIDGRLFFNVPTSDGLIFAADDDFIQLRLTWFF